MRSPPEGDCCKRRRRPARRSQRRVAVSNSTPGLQRTVTFACWNQTKLSDMIEGAVLNIFDSRLNAKLLYLLFLHRKQVEQLETFLT